ncbi:hypothetical protein E9993_09930 [Labilibacter sediminis]|nr:hypothetical protein E9993_09930 [Labilibacter sediminis]
MQRIELLKKIREQQANKNNTIFNYGIFPSYRSNKILGISRPDDNIFYSAATLYILKSLIPKLTLEEKTIIEEIEKDLSPNFKAYIDKYERNSYNFWQKKEHKHFPNGRILNKLNKFKLPDDMDTTSMIHMITGTPAEHALKTKLILPNHANKTNLTIKNGHPQLKHFKAYSTWFGKNMPIEFDVCVISNILLWVNKYSFELNQWDKASIQLLIKTISDSLYFKSPFRSAPEYPKIEIILYHLCRLASQTPYLNSVKHILIDDLQKVHSESTSDFSKLIIQSSLLKLGHKTTITSVANISIETRNYWWFTAGLLSVYSAPLIKVLAPQELFHFRYTCPAFNLALIFENRVLSKT